MKKRIIITFLVTLFSSISIMKPAFSCDEVMPSQNSSTQYNYQRYDIKIPFIHYKIHTFLDGDDFFSKPLEVIRFDDDIKTHPTQTSFEENSKTVGRELQRLIEPTSSDIEPVISIPCLTDCEPDKPEPEKEQMVDETYHSINLISEQRLTETLRINPKKERILSPLYNDFSYSIYSDSLFIYPSQPEQGLKQKIHDYMHDYTKIGQLTDISRTMMHGKPVLKWSLYNGKSRKHFYMILGNNYHYLLMSSPYGNTDSIERVIKDSVLL